MKNTLKYLLLTSGVLFPAVSFAALGGLQDLLIALKNTMSNIVPVLFGLSVLYFLWGVFQFIRNDAGNDKTRDDGKNKMIWGIVALFVFISIFGILNFISDTTEIDQGGVLNTNIFKQ